MTEIQNIYELAGGDVVVWVNEGGAISIKATDRFNDPVELADHEAMDLANLLLKLTRKAEG